MTETYGSQGKYEECLKIPGKINTRVISSPTELQIEMSTGAQIPDVNGHRDQRKVESVLSALCGGHTDDDQEVIDCCLVMSTRTWRKVKTIVAMLFRVDEAATTTMTAQIPAPQ